jgi:hypothetical protein
MITGSSSELQLFHDFLGQQLAAGGAAASVEGAVDEFRRYQQELAEIRAKLLVAEEQSNRGESAPFDAEASKLALRERLASHGCDR